MSIELYYSDFSPPSRMVLTTLHALGLNYEKKEIDLLKGEQRKKSYLVINPRGKVPSIKDGDFLISESRAISMYLCNQYEKSEDYPRLYPVDPTARGKVDQMLFVSESLSDMIQSYLNTSGVIFRGEMVKDKKISEVHKVLQLVERYLAKEKFIAGNHLTLADFYIVSPILLLDMVEFTDYRKYPKVISWMKTIKRLPYFDECNAEGIDTLKTMFCNALRSNEKMAEMKALQELQMPSNAFPNTCNETQTGQSLPTSNKAFDEWNIDQRESQLYQDNSQIEPSKDYGLNTQQELNDEQDQYKDAEEDNQQNDDVLQDGQSATAITENRVSATTVSKSQISGYKRSATAIPENQTSAYKISATALPESQMPGYQQSATAIPENQVPEFQQSATAIPENQVPEFQQSATAIPENQVPEFQQSATAIPENVESNLPNETEDKNFLSQNQGPQNESDGESLT